MQRICIYLDEREKPRVLLSTIALSKLQNHFTNVHVTLNSINYKEIKAMVNFTKLHSINLKLIERSMLNG